VRIWNRKLALATALAVVAVAAGLGARAGAPAVESADANGLKNAVAANKGKVVVLNLWATWCGPCVEEFPDLVKLSNNYRNKGVVVIGGSLDEPEDKQKVVDFLQKQKAAFPVIMRKAGVEPEAFVDPVDKKWPGAIPVTYVFDRNGKQVGESMVGHRTYAQFEAAVKKALARK
jgi:thiol-disulfide isomerase/thioredoxin